MAISRYSTLLWVIPLGLIVLLAFLFLAGKLGDVKVGFCDAGSPFECIKKVLENIHGVSGK